MNIQDSIKRPRKNIGIVRPVAEPTAYSLEAELSTLGGLILDNLAWPDVSGIVQQEDFHEEKNRVLFRAIRDLAAVGKPFDAVTLLDELERTGRLADAGGAPWIGQVGRDTPSAANVIHYARIVRRKALERQRAAAIDRGDHDRAVTLTAAIQALEAGTAGLSLRTIDDILARPITHDWLIKGWLERQQTIVLWGESQSYKTLLAIEMACAIATGTEWRGNRVKRGAVLYIAGEGGGNGITRRFKAWEIANQKSLAGCPLIFRESSTLLPTDTDTVIKETEAFLKARGWKLELVVLDTLARTMAGNENSQEDFGAYQHALDRLRDKFQCAVMVLHHTGHADKTRARGSSAIRANTDVELSMEPAGDKISKLHAWKVKDAGASDDMCFQLSVVELGSFDEEGTAITSVVLRHLADYTPEKRGKLSKDEQLVLNILERMRRDNSGTTADVPDVSDVTAIEVIALRTEFYTEVRNTRPDIEQDTLRKKWNRAINSLARKGQVTFEGINNTRVSGTSGTSGTTAGQCPVVPAGHQPQAGRTGHTPIGVSRCPGNVPVPLPADVREDLPKGDSDSKESDQAHDPNLDDSPSLGADYLDSLVDSLQPVTADDLDFSDDQRQPAHAETEADCRHCRQHAPHAHTCKAMDLYCDPLLEPLCAGRHFEPKESGHE